MCGIAGIITAAEPVAEERLRRMNAAMVHRGPDDEGVYVDGPAGLAMRRLSIIGVANGHQPIFNEDRSVVVVMNGEIYNYRQLKAALQQQRGHRFVTDSDAEVVVHLYEEQGAACLDALHGMFALALYDRRRRTLLLARDRSGKKPLYYAPAAGGLVFASEIKALHASGLVAKAPNPHTIDACLALGYVPGEETLFAGVRKLPAGCTLTATRAGTYVERYWDWPSAVATAASLDDAAARVRLLLDEAVARRLMSEVPLGAFLSGGIDSSTIVALMARRLEAPVQTFAVGFDDGALDELACARQVAERLGTRHREVVVRACSPELLREITWHHDEPAADPAAVPTYVLSKAAREHVTVVLTGEGGDELFAGYRHYRLQRQLLALEARMPGVRATARAAARLAPALGHRGARRWWKGIWIAGRPWQQRGRDWLSAFTDAELRRLYAPAFRTAVNGHRADTFHEYEARAAGLDPVGQAMYLDAKLHLADQLLMKVDKMTMAASLEARCPLLDQALIEYVAALPTALKLDALASKRVLRAAVRGLVPDDILTRPKQGFDPPVRRWLLEDLEPCARALLLDRGTPLRRYFDVGAVRDLWEGLRRRRDPQLARQCWVLLAFAVWHDLHWPNGVTADVGEGSRTAANVGAGR
jgi:asparagine synthase (glutamine-hydrolysing)